jgi:hypothetical protein
VNERVREGVVLDDRHCSSSPFGTL